MQNVINMDRVNHNILALKELYHPVPDINLLKNYTGWGGLKNAIFDEDIFKKMRSVLTSEEISSLQRTINTAYYTPPTLVHFIYKRLAELDYSPKKILEPSAGHGVFLDLMPAKMFKHAKITAVECDKVSARLLKLIYPSIHIFEQGFEHFNNDERFDLIIGNPPFGQILLQDKCHAAIANYSIHHYFLGKCMRLLEENGILAMVLPKYCLDNRFKHVRHIISREGGSLIEAFRMPNDLFSDAQVTVDVVLLKKARSTDNNWLYTRKFEGDGRFVHINNYYFANQDHILGELKFIDIYGRTEITCIAKPMRL